MNEMNVDWDDFRLFLAVARSGGLSAAAESTGKSAPTLSRRMLALERLLSRSLFDRQPRGYILTEDGEQLLQAVESMVSAVNPVINNIGLQSVHRVKLSAGTWVNLKLCQTLPLKIIDPTIQLQFISAEHILDIHHRETVIGIRNQRPTQATLTARRTGNVQFAQYAACEEADRFVQVLGHTPSARWVASQPSKLPNIEVTNPRSALDIAQLGIAKVVLPTFIGDHCAELSRISPTIDDLEHQQWLVTHQDDRHIPAVRTVIDSVYEELEKLI